MTIRLARLFRLAALAAALAFPVTALAQQPAAQSQPRHEGLGIGVKGGPLFTSLNVKDVDEVFDTQTGIIGGLFLGGNRPGVVGVGVDLLYGRKTAKVHGTDLKINMDYIEVPVYARINAGSRSLNGVLGYFTVGLDLNFLLKSKFTDGDDVTDDFERADYGVAVGAGVEITRFIVEARFTKGLGNLAKDKDDPVVKAQTFAVMFGVRFN